MLLLQYAFVNLRGNSASDSCLSHWQSHAGPVLKPPPQVNKNVYKLSMSNNPAKESFSAQICASFAQETCKLQVQSWRVVHAILSKTQTCKWIYSRQTHEDIFSDKKIHGHAHELNSLLILRFSFWVQKENQLKVGGNLYTLGNYTKTAHENTRNQKTHTALWSRKVCARFAQGRPKSHFRGKEFRTTPM